MVTLNYTYTDFKYHIHKSNFSFSFLRQAMLDSGPRCSKPNYYYPLIK